MKFIIQKLKKNLEIFALLSLIISATIFTSYYNYKKTIDNKIYNNFIDNIYFKKTLSHLVDNLEPKL